MAVTDAMDRQRVRHSTADRVSAMGITMRVQAMDAASRITRNTAIVRSLLEDVLGRGQVHLITDLIADDYVGHLAIGDHYGPEGVRIDVVAYRTAFPDLTVTVDDLFATGAKVVRRFTLRGTHHKSFLGIPANGQRVELHVIAIDRLDGGLVLESWVQGGTLHASLIRAEAFGSEH